MRGFLEIIKSCDSRTRESDYLRRAKLCNVWGTILLMLSLAGRGPSMLLNVIAMRWQIQTLHSPTALSWYRGDILFGSLLAQGVIYALLWLAAIVTFGLSLTLRRRVWPIIGLVVTLICLLHGLMLMNSPVWTNISHP